MGSVNIEAGSKWERINDGAEVTVRETFVIDGFLLGLINLIEYSVIDPQWKEKGHSSPVVVGTCQDTAWAEHFRKSN